MIVSIANEVALEGKSIFAGGLGVLEGDKFYTFSELGEDYLLLTLFYPLGYVRYSFEKGEIKAEKDEFPLELRSRLSEIARDEVEFSERKILTSYFEYKEGKARIIFIRPTDEAEAERILSRLYDHNDDSGMFYRYLFFSKAALKFLEKHIGFEKISVIDIQEAFLAFLPLLLSEKEKRPKIRLILHTPVPWGHPRVHRELFKKEFGYEFISQDVYLTDLAASLCDEIITVSKKHLEVSKRMFPHFSRKMKSITNGIHLKRWMHPELYKLYRDGNLDREEVFKIKSNAKKELIRFLSSYKNFNEDRIIITWTRRTVLYKRPYFILSFIENNAELEAYYILGGKTDPRDIEGQGFMKKMKELSEKFSNVIYLWDYDVEIAKRIFRGSDLNIFTPLSGWEACGTSMMKAGVNATPTLSSKDGASLELIRDGYNGWFFGEELKESIMPGSERAKVIDSKEFIEFSEKLKKIIELWYNEKEKFREISYNALISFLPLVSSERMIREYYPELSIFKK